MLCTGAKKTDLNFPDLRGRHKQSLAFVRAGGEGCRKLCCWFERGLQSCLFVFSTALFNLKVDVDAADEACL